MLDCPDSVVDAIFAELESDRELLGELNERYRSVRDNSRYPLEIGRFKIWYAIVRLFRPIIVMETGVHDGLSSSIILAGMDRNGSGSLVSIDLPSTDLPPRVTGPGWLVPRLSHRWSLHLGDARRLLPELAQRYKPVDVFIHDSDHSIEHMEFEYRTIRPHLANNSLILSDADLNEELLDRLSAEWEARRFRVRSAGPLDGLYGTIAPDFIGGLKFDQIAAGSKSSRRE
jgi:predicted O-methyltransferase YrrM